MIASSIVRGILIGAKIVSSTVTLSKTATSQQSLNKIEGRHLGDIMSDEATQNPNFEILLFHNDKKIEIDLQKRGIEQTIPTHFLLEKILSVDRHCSSRWKYIPSGIATVFTWTLTGMACRHEYFIIETENYVIKIEVPKDEIKQENGTVIDWPIIKIQILDAQNHDQRIKAKNKLCDQEHYDRSMKKLQNKDILPDMRFEHIIYMIYYWRMFHLEENSDKMGLNGKSLCRTLLYFSMKESDIDWIMYSIMGCFTDKPMEVFIRIDQIIIEKLMLQVYQKVKEEEYDQSKKLVEILRNIQLNMKEGQNNIEQIENQLQQVQF